MLVIMFQYYLWICVTIIHDFCCSENIVCPFVLEQDLLSGWQHLHADVIMILIFIHLNSIESLTSEIWHDVNILSSIFLDNHLLYLQVMKSLYNIARSQSQSAHQLL